MKRFLLIFLSACGVLLPRAQQVIDLRSGQLTDKISSTIPTRDVEELQDGYKVTYTFDNALILQDKLFKGTTFWKIEGFGLNETPGDPSTLFRNDLIAIPLGLSAKVEVTDSTYRDYHYELTPARQALLNSNNGKHTRENVTPIKAYDGYKPAKVAYLTGIQSYRGQNICMAAVSPIQYNYYTKTVRAFTSITYKVTFIPHEVDAKSKASAPMHISREDHFLLNNVIGGRGIATSRNESVSSAQTDVQDYLILSTSTYTEAVNQFAEWKRLLGFNVHTIIRDDWTTTSVMSAVTNVYAANPTLYYLLIIGDHSDVPAQQSTLIRSHVTDFHYGCMDNDFTTDIYCGRLPVSSLDEAMIVIGKIISYEKTPPTSQSFYNKGLHCAYFQDTNGDSYADRRFAQTSEDVRTYVMSQGKSIQRVYKTLYSVTPLYWNNTIYSNGESIPNELRKPTFAWNGNATNINTAINNGVFYVLHRDHGTITGWGDPQYLQQNISSLSNGSLLPVVFSMNCLTGKFNGYCFAETFLRKSSGGCVAIFGATEVSYSGYNDALTTGMFDAIWPNPGLQITIPSRNSSFSVTPSPTYALGQILAQGMVRMYETYGSTTSYTEYTKEIFHCFGDPSMRIYTQTPTAFSNVAISRNTGSITINTGESENVRITVYNPISGDVQSYIGSSATITTPNPYEVVVCVSAHNHIPFIQYPDVMYIQNINITGTLNETHDKIKVGNHVTTTVETGDVTTSNANITLRAREVTLDSGTYISTGSTLSVDNP